MTAPALLLHQLAIRYRVERGLSRALSGVGVAAVASGLSHLAGVEQPAAIGVGAAMLFGVMLTAWWQDRRESVAPLTVARHLDRSLPDMEESTSLLLTPPDQLTGLARLQRERTERSWRAERARAAMPRAALRRGTIAAVAGALVGAGLWLEPGAPAGARSLSRAGERITLRRVTLAITPPAYTGTRDRSVTDRDVEIEEGASVGLRVETGGAVKAVWLVPIAGDSLPLHEATQGVWQLTLRADRSQLVRVRLRGPHELVLTSDDYRLGVKPDKPPVLTIVRPEERTTYAPESLASVPVEVLATDDYGVDRVIIAATIASGRGEAVRFRRLQIPFASRVRSKGGEALGAMLDLPALQLGPGDELYFHVEATDQRTPLPNRVQSGTVFLSVRDTASNASAELARLAIGVQPEYFRSHRQLIIDTERLLADQPSMSEPQFRERANDLGMDQGLLRLRYGQFLGEEFAEEARPMGGREHAAEETPQAGDEVVDEKKDGQGRAAEAPSRRVVEEFTHKHDNTENATLLGAAVKRMLKDAVGAMWQAELHLRVAEPRKALPYMYQALVLIKQIQQDARSYVQRVGFDPPPIEVDKLRLSGKLTGISDRRLTADARRREDLPGVRAALAALPSGTGAPGRRLGLSLLLETAGGELAVLAVSQPSLLPALLDIRVLNDSLTAGRDCPLCQARVERALWQALPEPEPRPSAVSPGASPVTRRFARLLHGGKP